MSKNTRLVYSTESGRIKPGASPQQRQPEGDGIARIRRETKGRKGKGVTTISGLALPAAELKALARELKQLCGTGGSIKNGVIEIPGDKRELIKAALESKSILVSSN